MTKFKTYDQSRDWLEKKAKEYGSKNEFLASEEYKKAYPELVSLEKKKLTDISKRGAKAMKEVKVKEGDTVEYDAVSPFGIVESYCGKLIIKRGTPYVKLKEKALVAGKGYRKTVRWHKGFRKVNKCLLKK